MEITVVLSTCYDSDSCNILIGITHLKMEITVILNTFCLSESCNILTCVTHLIILKIIYARSYYCYQFTNEKIDMQRSLPRTHSW